VDRLLLAPSGSVLLCAAFPDVGIPSRPTHKNPRKIRVLSKKEKSKLQPKQPQGACFVKNAEESTEGESNLCNYLDEEDVPAEHQVMPSDEMDVDEELDEELDDGQTDAGCEFDSPDS
jgi:hypothetical protein